MGFSCPRCGGKNDGDSRLYLKVGYTRCEKCKIGIEWTSKLLSREVTPKRTYVPPGCTISPKTGRVLDPERFSRTPTGVLILLTALIWWKNLKISQLERNGMLKKDPTRHRYN